MGTVLNNFKNLTNMWMNYKLLKLFIKIKSLFGLFIFCVIILRKL